MNFIAPKAGFGPRHKVGVWHLQGPLCKATVIYGGQNKPSILKHLCIVLFFFNGFNML